MDLKTIPHEWVHLTEEKGEYVRYNSCDAGNLLISISEKNSRHYILYHGQQEDFQFTVDRQIALVNDTLEITASWFHAKDMQLKFAWVDRQKQVACWITGYPNGQTTVERFVSAAFKNNFKEINQPCKECWDECEE